MKKEVNLFTTILNLERSRRIEEDFYLTRKIKKSREKNLSLRAITKSLLDLARQSLDKI